MSKYQIIRRRKIMPIPSIWHANYQTSNSTIKIHGVCLKKVLMLFENGWLTQFNLEDSWEKAGCFVKNRILKEPNYINGIYKTQKKIGKQLIKYAEKYYHLNLENFDGYKLKQAFKIIKQYYLDYNSWNVLPWFVGGDYLLNEIKQQLKKFSNEEINILATPSKNSFSQKEELDILLVLFKIKKEKLSIESNTVLNELKKLEKRYYWIPVGYDEFVFNDLQHYKNIVKNDARSMDEILTKIKNIKNYEKELIIKQKSLINRVNDKLIYRVICNMRTLSIMTDERKEFTFRAHAGLNKLLKQLAEINCMTYEQIKYLTDDEILLLENGNFKQIAEERINGKYLVYGEKGNLFVCNNKETLEFLSDLESDTLRSEKNITGMVASHGSKDIIQGKIKIILHQSENENINNGEILVATMTTPEFVPAMRKATAIITDEGGVTCHAAIVSRELGIPCIIGTKIATKVLKDGDMVKVDANNGIIKIVNKQ